jgi:HEAT repeat protein
MATKPARQTGSGSGNLGDFLKIRPGEGRAVFLLGLAIMATEGGFWLGGNAVDALVFSRFNPFEQIFPFLLIAKGFLAFFAISLYNVWLVRVNRARLLAATSLSTMLILLLARFYMQLNPPDFFYIALFPVTYVIPDLLSLSAWTLAAEAFDSRQSKRLFPLIQAVGVVGIVGGNFLTPVLTQVLKINPQDIVTAWAGLVLVAFLGMLALRRQIDRDQPVIKRRKNERGREEREGMWSRLRLGYTFVRYYRIIYMLAFAIALTWILYYVLWLFFLEDSLARYGSDPAAFAGFLGIVNGGATLVASIISLFLVNRLFSSIGIRNMLLALPLNNLISFGLLLVQSTFAPVVGTRVSQMIVKDGLNNSTAQTLYNLMPAETRDVARNFNKAVSEQLGVIIAGLLLILPGRIGLEAAKIPLLILGLILSLVYVGISWSMRRQYRSTLVQLLKEGQQEFFSNEEDGGFSADLGASSGDDPVTIAITNLEDPSEGTRRLSAELLGKIGAQEGLGPLIHTVLMDASPEVRRTAIVALKSINLQESLPTIAEAMTDADASVRAEAAAALREIDYQADGRPPDPMAFYFLRKALADSSPSVKREAALTMAAYGRKGEALWVLWEMGHSNDSAIRREAAVAYGVLGDRVLVRELVEMLDDADPGVRREAAAALGNLPTKQSMEALLATLEDDNPSVREQAANSLALMRARAGRAVLQYIFSTTNPKGQAAALHSLSLAKMYEQQEAQAERWADETNRLHRNGNYADSGPNRSLANLSETIGFELRPQDEQRLLAYGKSQIALAKRLYGYMQGLSNLAFPPVSNDPNLQLAVRARRDPSNLLLINRSLKDRYDAAVLRAVNIVGLLGNVEAINLVASGLQEQGRNAARLRADAIETLENLGDPRLTPDLIALLEARDDQHLNGSGRSLSEILIEIWLEGDEWLRACVLHVIGMFDLRRLRPLVDQVLETDLGDDTEVVEAVDPWVEEAAMEAQQRLEWPRDDYELNRLLEKSLSEKDMQTLGTLSTMSRILFLQKVPIFANLSPEDLRRVALVSRERLFSPNEIICYEGDPGDELYIVVSGRVQVLVGFGEAGAKTVAVMGEGEAVGEVAILDDVPRTATLRAYGGPVRLLTLGADEFKRILRERPELAIEVIRVLSRRLDGLNKRVQATSNTLDNVTAQFQQLGSPAANVRR